MLNKDKLLRIFLIFYILIFFPLCAPRKKIGPTPEQLLEINTKIKEADILLKKGSYTCLKEAYQIYQDLLTLPVLQKEIRVNLLKTAFLLSLRENELGILDDTHLTEALNLFKNYPYLSEFSDYLEIVKISSSRAKRGYKFTFDSSSSIDSYFAWIKKNAEPLNARLKEKAETEEFFAYLYITLNDELSYSIKEKDDFSRFLKIFPDSSLIQYKLALYPKINQKSLEELVHKEPSFHEAYYFLGKIDLMLGRIISAEKNFLKAYKQIPKSISITTSLTKTYFAYEEFEKCIEFNEKVLQLAPGYRDALLGKAICLSYLGRSEEAIEILNKLLEQGMYLMGETHYWLAWNQNELEKYQEAWENIENAKKYLIGHHEVLSLSGIIAFEMGNLKKAERDFKEAIKLNQSNCESLFYLGKIYSVWEDWTKAGLNFEKAALCYEKTEKALGNKIKEIERSSFTEERKKKLILRKKMQLIKTRLTKATSFYNGAAGYFNAGEKEKSLILAKKAAMHSAFKEKAEELIKRFKIKNWVQIKERI